MLQRGRYPESRDAVIGEIEVLTKSDLAIVLEQRTTPQRALAKIRDPHHNVARLIAAGVKPNSAIAARTGYSINRISILSKDPAFAELVDYYRKLIVEGYREEVDDYVALATSNMLKAERMLAEKLERIDEEDESLPVRDLIAISRDAADRFGYGKKTTKDLNVNMDFASQLEKTIARSKTIDARPAPMRVVQSPTLSAPALSETPPALVTPRRRSIA